MAGAAMTQFGRHANRTLTDLAQEAAYGALADAGLGIEDLDAVVFSNSFAGVMTGQESIRGEVALSQHGFGHRPLWNVENACASGSTAVLTGTNAILAGRCETVLVVGAEKLFDEDRSKSFHALETATDVATTRDDRDGSRGRSVFMDHYARKARAYLAEHGVASELFAHVSVKNSRHGAANPFAQHRVEHSLEAVLGARPIVDPLTLFMCSPISDGAAAVVLTAPGQAPVGAPRIIGMGLRAGNGEGDPTSAAAAQALAEAGVRPDDLDVLELHDATAPSEILALEDMGIFNRGEAAARTAAGATTYGGQVVVNPSGGLLSRGHPVGATGVAQIVELTWQLSGKAGDRQVEGAALGAAQNAGGVLADDVAVACVTILANS